jgi:hypothetical protein
MIASSIKPARGYEYCLNNLAALSQVPKQTKAIEATFQPVK